MTGRISPSLSQAVKTISVSNEFRLQLATQTRFQAAGRAAVYPLNVWNQMRAKNYYYR